jgi:hypothetical protein
LWWMSAVLCADAPSCPFRPLKGDRRPPPAPHHRPSRPWPRTGPCECDTCMAGQ